MKFKKNFDQKSCISLDEQNHEQKYYHIQNLIVESKNRMKNQLSITLPDEH